MSAAVTKLANSVAKYHHLKVVNFCQENMVNFFVQNST